MVGDDADTVGFQASPFTVTVPDVPLATAFQRLVVVPPIASCPCHVMGEADVVVTFTSVQNPEAQSDVMVSANAALPTGVGTGTGVGVGAGGGVGAGVGAGAGVGRGAGVPIRIPQYPKVVDAPAASVEFHDSPLT